MSDPESKPVKERFCKVPQEHLRIQARNPGAPSRWRVLFAIQLLVTHFDRDHGERDISTRDLERLTGLHRGRVMEAPLMLAEAGLIKIVRPGTHAKAARCALATGPEMRTTCWSGKCGPPLVRKPRTTYKKLRKTVKQ